MLLIYNWLNQLASGFESACVNALCSKETIMKHQYKFYGWQASFFAGKARGYLNYKGVDYVEKEISLFDILYTIPKHTGRKAMPALKNKKGEWFCDTPLMIEELEKRHLEPSISTDGPIQNFVAELFHNWVDDCWIPIALHTRWSYPENYEKINREEGGKNLMPFAPRFIRNKIVDKAFLQNMLSHKENMGFVPEQIELFEAWAVNLLNILETHFSEHGYLLGERPTIADFALFGPMFAHLNRDPWPKREWLDPRPNLQKWVEKMHRGQKCSGELLLNDQIPMTLMPIIKIILSEYLPFMEDTVKETENIIKLNQLKSGDKLPRSTKILSMRMLDGQYKRAAFTYSIWRMQRFQKMLADYSPESKASLITWLTSLGIADFLNLNFGHELKRDGLKAALV